ncbi:hypothetical protein RB195_011578 [Necator americanus]|uniref:CCD97-like C-terminal domain-containing protein n=1 Tax=Necator americanus TaxID=51031 RepID=A0ABR1D319_NECAM
MVMEANRAVFAELFPGLTRENMLLKCQEIHREEKLQERNYRRNKFARALEKVIFREYENQRLRRLELRDPDLVELLEEVFFRYETPLAGESEAVLWTSVKRTLDEDVWRRINRRATDDENEEAQELNEYLFDRLHRESEKKALSHRRNQSARAVQKFIYESALRNRQRELRRELSLTTARRENRIIMEKFKEFFFECEQMEEHERIVYGNARRNEWEEKVWREVRVAIDGDVSRRR